MPAVRRGKGARTCASSAKEHPEKAIVAQRIAADLASRLAVLLDLGLGYLSLDRSTPTLSPGELQRLRLATQVRSNLFGVVYVLDEPSAGLHPRGHRSAAARAGSAQGRAATRLFVVEHELDVIRHADWIVDVGPAAGENGGRVLYSGPPDGTERRASVADRALSLRARARRTSRTPRVPRGWLRLAGVTRNNLRDLDVAFPLGVLTTVTGVSGSGKSSLVSQALVELVAEHSAHEVAGADEDEDVSNGRADRPSGGRIASRHGSTSRRLVRVDQKPIGRTPRSNLATYTGLVRSRPQALRRHGGRRSPPLRCRAVLVQRGEGPLRKLRGRRVRDGGAAVPAERLRALPDVSRRPLQRQDARDPVSRQERSPTCSALTVDAAAEFFARRAARAPLAATCCGKSASAICDSASPRPSCPAARRSGSSSRPNCSAHSAATRSTSSTSRRPACIPSDVEKLMTAARRPGRRRQHRDRRRARHAGRRGERLGHRHGAWRG